MPTYIQQNALELVDVIEEAIWRGSSEPQPDFDPIQLLKDVNNPGAGYVTNIDWHKFSNNRVLYKYQMSVPFLDEVLDIDLCSLGRLQGMTVQELHLIFCESNQVVAYYDLMVNLQLGVLVPVYQALDPYDQLPIFKAIYDLGNAEKIMKEVQNTDEYLDNFEILTPVKYDTHVSLFSDILAI